MYSIKFVPYPYSVEDQDKGIHMLSADEYKWSVKYPATLDELNEIFSENHGFRVIWELPMNDMPENGISLIILTTYRNTNLEGLNSLRVETYIAYDCSMYVMNDSGKTIDRVG